MIQETTIKTRLPTCNEYIDACRTNKYVAARMKREAEFTISLFIRKLTPVNSKVMIHFVWHERDQKRDPDNVAFGKKFVFDALVARKILPNDNAKWVLGFDDTFDYCGWYGVTIKMEEK